MINLYRNFFRFIILIFLYFVILKWFICFCSSLFTVVLIKAYIDEPKIHLIDVDENKRILPRSTRQYQETKVVVAHDSQRFHGSDTARFVNTVMNMVCSSEYMVELSLVSQICRLWKWSPSEYSKFISHNMVKLSLVRSTTSRWDLS